MAYCKSYSQLATGINADQVWQIWSDIGKRHLWDDDTKWAKMDGDFEEGNTFVFKPKGGPKLKMTIVECRANQCFTDCFKLPFAALYGKHEIQQTEKGLLLVTTISVKGLFSWLWGKILADGIVKTLPRQTNLLIEAAKKVT